MPSLADNLAGASVSQGHRQEPGWVYLVIMRLGRTNFRKTFANGRRVARGWTCGIALVPMVGSADDAEGDLGRGAKPYNILFIVADDLRPQLGIYGEDGISTPHINRLAASGFTFDRAYCQQAVCSPSRTSVMTGLRPDTTRVYNLRRHFRKTVPWAITLPQFFKNQGYHAVAFGKIFHADLDDAASWSEPWQQVGGTYYQLAGNRELTGEDVSETFEEGEWEIAPNENGRPKRGPATESARVPESRYPDARMADLAIRKMEEFTVFSYEAVI